MKIEIDNPEIERELAELARAQGVGAAELALRLIGESLEREREAQREIEAALVKSDERSSLEILDEINRDVEESWGAAPR